MYTNYKKPVIITRNSKSFFIHSSEMDKNVPFSCSPKFEDDRKQDFVYKSA